MADIMRLQISKNSPINAYVSRTTKQMNVTVTPSATSKYVLPAATADTLGGIKVGEALEIHDGVLSVIRANTAEQDNTMPITSAAVYTELGNITELLKTI